MLSDSIETSTQGPAHTQEESQPHQQSEKHRLKCTEKSPDKLKGLIIPSLSEDVGRKWELLYTAGGSINLHNHFGEQFGNIQ